jgi:hypothetical protein
MECLKCCKSTTPPDWPASNDVTPAAHASSMAATWTKVLAATGRASSLML